MYAFKEYLMKKFGKPVSEISSTEFDNQIINKKFKMICWDDVATYFNESNDEFKGEFSSADGLYIFLKKKIIFSFSFLNLKMLTIQMMKIGR